MIYEEGYLLDGVEQITGYFDECLLEEKRSEVDAANKYECNAHEDELNAIGFVLTKSVTYFLRPRPNG